MTHHTPGHPPLTPDQRADLLEAANIERYAAMRALWSPCWARQAAAMAQRPRRTPVTPKPLL